MQWTSEAQKPEDYKVVLLQTIGGHFTTGWYAPQANNGTGAWIGLALNQSPPVYEIEPGFVKAWCEIAPPDDESTTIP